MADPTVARSNFLRDASHLLAASSPAVSASLGSTRNRLAEESNGEITSKEWDALRRETCGACGNLMVPGWSCRVEKPSRLHMTNKNVGSKPKNPKRVDSRLVYTCLRCYRRTTQVLPLPPRRQLKVSKSLPETKLPIHPRQPVHEDHSKAPKSANANSKQRQKARKGGLQAMLEKNKTHNSNQGGLDLMDFAM